MNRQPFLLMLLPVMLLADGARAQELSNREAAVAVGAAATPALKEHALHTIAEGLSRPWSFAFLPAGGILVTERHAGVRLIGENGALSAILSGGPKNVLRLADSGFLDIALDPRFAANGLVYLAFAEGTEDANRTAIWRARWDGRRLRDGRAIFRANVDKRGPSHPGGRLLFLPDETLLLSVGDGFDYRDDAQNMKSHLGKVLRLTRDGAPAPDNPFVGRADIAPEIWTSGHRNIQGLTLDRATGAIWSHEHGPRGGDEINLLRAGADYGWPLVTYGVDYDGSLISERQSSPEFERPAYFWSPSIAPSGLMLYRGDRYPDFTDKVFVGGLAARALIRVRFGRDGSLLHEDARMYSSLRARIRDVRAGPDGLIYLLTDEETDARLLRIAPHDARALNARGRSTRDLDFWIGRWEGEAVFTPAFRPDAAPRREAVVAACEAILDGAYIQCDATFTRGDGRSRGVMSLWNYNDVSGSYEGMTLASNYGEETTFRVAWDAAEQAFVGALPTRTADGRAAMERLIFRRSADGRSIEGVEMIKPDAAPEGPWTTTFVYTWRRIE